MVEHVQQDARQPTERQASGSLKKIYDFPSLMQIFKEYVAYPNSSNDEKPGMLGGQVMDSTGNIAGW